MQKCTHYKFSENKSKGERRSKSATPSKGESIDLKWRYKSFWNAYNAPKFAIDCKNPSKYCTSMAIGKMIFWNFGIKCRLEMVGVATILQQLFKQKKCFVK